MSLLKCGLVQHERNYSFLLGGSRLVYDPVEYIVYHHAPVTRVHSRVLYNIVCNVHLVLQHFHLRFNRAEILGILRLFDVVLVIILFYRCETRNPRSTHVHTHGHPSCRRRFSIICGVYYLTIVCQGKCQHHKALCRSCR